jgi:Immunity protein 50
MPLPTELESIPGAPELYSWFGYWPDFHDAEVVTFRVDFGSITLVAHTWEMTNRINSAGFYELVKHVTVEFTLDGVTTLNVQDPWEHSILLSLGINKTDAGVLLDMVSAYGLCGTIEAKKVSLRVTPGKAQGDDVSS